MYYEKLKLANRFTGVEKTKPVAANNSTDKCSAEENENYVAVSGNDLMANLSDSNNSNFSDSDESIESSSDYIQKTCSENMREETCGVYIERLFERFHI